MSSSNTYFFIYDLETTDKHLDSSIVEFGVILCTAENDKLVEKDRLCQRVKPVVNGKRVRMAKKAIAITGIKDSDLDDKPTFDLVIPKIKEFIERNLPKENRQLYFVAHNGQGFDDVITFNEFIRVGYSLKHFLEPYNFMGFIDTLQVLKENNVLGHSYSPPTLKLGDVYSCWHGGELNWHGATADCLGIIGIVNSNTFQNHVGYYNFTRSKAAKALKCWDFILTKVDEDTIKLFRNFDYEKYGGFKECKKVRKFENDEEEPQDICMECMQIMITNHHICGQEEKEEEEITIHSKPIKRKSQIEQEDVVKKNKTI